MAISNRDRRALQWGAAALAVWIVLQYAVLPAWDRWQQTASELPIRENALIKYRQAVAASGTEKKTAETLANRLHEAESGLLASATPALASAELQEWARQATANHAIEVRSSEFLAVRPQRDGYAQIPLGLHFQCHLDQLVDFLAELRTGPKIVAVPRLQIQPTGGPDKLVSVDLTLAGVMRAQGSPASPTP
jgi:type II secretory pathway component PulM